MKLKVTVTTVENKVSKDGKRYVRVWFSMFGASFNLIVPEKFVPDCVEGKEVVIEFGIRPGKWGSPDLVIRNIENA